MSHARDRFIELLQRDLLGLDAADLNFDIDRAPRQTDPDPVDRLMNPLHAALPATPAP